MRLQIPFTPIVAGNVRSFQRLRGIRLATLLIAVAVCAVVFGLGVQLYRARESGSAMVPGIPPWQLAVDADPSRPEPHL